MNESTTILVSVIIPSYNCEKYIEESILSVINQTIRAIEIIVVDDGSTDNQKEKIVKLAHADSRIKYYYQKNSGVSVARNFGFHNSSGKYIAFLDSDDVWMPENLEEKIKKIQNTDFGLVHSDALIIDQNSMQTDRLMYGREGNLLNGLLEWQEPQIPGPSSILVRRDVLLKVGLFDTNISTSADKEFFIRVAAHYKIGRVNKITWFYRIHTNNMHKNIKLMEHDTLYTYKIASIQNFFHNESFKRECIVNMYLILSASWFGDGNNKRRAFYFLIKAILMNKSLIFKIPFQVIKKWMKV